MGIFRKDFSPQNLLLLLLGLAVRTSVAKIKPILRGYAPGNHSGWFPQDWHRIGPLICHTL